MRFKNESINLGVRKAYIVTGDQNPARIALGFSGGGVWGRWPQRVQGGALAFGFWGALARWRVRGYGFVTGAVSGGRDAGLRWVRP